MLLLAIHACLEITRLPSCSVELQAFDVMYLYQENILKPLVLDRCFSA